MLMVSSTKLIDDTLTRSLAMTLCDLCGDVISTGLVMYGSGPCHDHCLDEMHAELDAQCGIEDGEFFEFDGFEDEDQEIDPSFFIDPAEYVPSYEEYEPSPYSGDDCSDPGFYGDDY